MEDDGGWSRGRAGWGGEGGNRGMRGEGDTHSPGRAGWGGEGGSRGMRGEGDTHDPSRGRAGWGGEGGSRGMRGEGDTHSPRQLHHSGSPSHKLRPARPVWDDTVNDLASMRLTPAELARKLASRQSSNKVLARAQMLEHTRRSGSQCITIPANLAARLHARQQSVDSILAHSNATLATSQRVRHTEPAHEPRTTKHRHHSDGDTVPEDRGSREDILRNLRMHQERFCHTSNNVDAATAPKNKSDASHNRVPEHHTRGRSRERGRPSSRSASLENTKRESQGQVNSPKPGQKKMDLSQLVATRTSLDHTITMVVNTCRELWLQLEEERLTREHLQLQLQQQGNVITSLTSELLLIQDQQEAIIQEVSDARASGLWGVDGDLIMGGGGGGGVVGGSSGGLVSGEELLGSHSIIGRAMGVNANPHPVPPSHHPQRSILKATRTINTPHMHQPPPYQMLPQAVSRGLQGNPHMPPSQPPPLPPSPRPHQPSPRLHSQTTHQPSPPPEPQSSLAPSRPDPRTLANYRSSVSRKIRDALVNEQVSGVPHDRSNTSTPLGFMGPEESQDPVHVEKELRIIGDNQPHNSGANKENCLMPVRNDVGLDPALSEQLERKKSGLQ